MVRSIVRIVAALLVGAAVVTLSRWWLQEPPAPAVGAAQMAAAPPAAAPAQSPAVPPGATADSWMVSNASGVTLDASRLFELGFAGGLVIDSDTRSAIETLVNTLPETPTEQDMGRLERTLREGLPREEAEKALKLVLDYRSYTRDMREQVMPQGIPTTVADANALFERMDEIKRRHFDDATAQALFGAEETYARIAMEAALVRQDESLSPEQKQARLEALRARLPADRKAMIPGATPAS